MVDARNGRVTYFVVGDIGPSLGEASTVLHNGLRDGQPPPVASRTSVPSNSVCSLVSGTAGDFHIAIFRHTSTRLGGGTMLFLIADALGPWIARTGSDRLAAIGGPGRPLACTPQ